MHRRAFLLSTAGLAAVPNPSTWGVRLLPAAFSPPAEPGDFDGWRRAFVERAAANGFSRDQVGTEIEGLTSDLGRKIWQKITILSELDENAPRRPIVGHIGGTDL